MKDKNVIVTGGLGFIGSHLTDRLLENGNKVTVIDDCSTGSINNLTMKDHENLKIIKGSITNLDLEKIFKGKDYIFHQAALASVEESIKNPIKCHEINATGTLKILQAAKKCNIIKVLHASTSAVYGDNPNIPLNENENPKPLSPYAASKVSAESYCHVYTQCYGLKTVSLRYFNVFGPRQNPKLEYAAVIPRFINAILSGERPIIYGNGNQTRDFIYVEDIVEANLLLAESKFTGPVNIATGESITINKLLELIEDILDVDIKPIYHDPRPGDIIESRADIGLLKSLGFKKITKLKSGLEKTIEWYKEEKTRLGGILD
ncbi:SDR family oxidoreductase [Methanothermobacter tenebrarum]|uniref:GDP-mannose 4,6-dehydratase n=1 Tax=Methanothermobacter tenebrarum TaxID=680118 RepID=A0A328P936_9EURY|nr:SDR family oxidoreductase [Methanothermobacter tenebrarum]MBC7100999.1 SDR family oxidoreductase [Methanobacteriales archaeon]MBC7117427.1 SDR family oxidoreductase [Methanobacteriaceae archaeon]NPV64695.1 SDR family oxidoreductase [Methanobacteriaceae archaeon]RAO79028.1 GDP-mannose 4,6-dehydratase [Methanothermobacter tenebrarum]